MNVYIGDPASVFIRFSEIEKIIERNVLFLATGSTWIKFRDKMLFIMSVPNANELTFNYFGKKKSFNARSGILCAASFDIFLENELDNISDRGFVVQDINYKNIYSKANNLYLNSDIYVET